MGVKIVDPITNLRLVKSDDGYKLQIERSSGKCGYVTKDGISGFIKNASTITSENIVFDTYSDLLSYNYQENSPVNITVLNDEDKSLENSSYTWTGEELRWNDEKYHPIVKVVDGISEWWCHPVATYLYQPFERTVIGSISSTGKIIANEYIHSTNTLKSFVVGQSVVDDHCSPALYAENGKRMLIMWNNHNSRTYLSMRVSSLSGDITKWLPEVRVELGGAASYNQIHKIKSLSNSTQDTFFILTRRANVTWGMVVISVDQISGAITVVTPYRPILDGTSNQCYVTSADAFNLTGDQVLRLAFCYNPAQPTHDLYYLEINLNTGAVSSITTPALSANIYTPTNLPIPDTSITPLLPTTADKSRRLFYVGAGPLPPIIAYADWDITTPDEATYKTIRYQAPVANGGLRTGVNYGRVFTPHKSSMNTNDFEGRIAFTFNVIPTNNFDIMRKRTATADGWYLQITNEKKIRFGYTTGGGALRTITSTNPVSFAWTDKMYVGFRYRNSVSGRSRVYLLTSTDGTTWTTFEDIDLGASAAPIENTFPIYLPNSSSAAGANHNVTIESVRLMDINNVDIVGINFANQTSGLQQVTGTTGEIWTLENGAEIVGSGGGWVIEEYGIAGTRIGYTPEANYIAGMNFPSPRYDDIVYVTRTSTEGDTLEKYEKNFGDSNYNHEILVNSKKRLIRPYSPINSYALPILYSEVHNYGEETFTIYLSDIKGKFLK